MMRWHRSRARDEQLREQLHDAQEQAKRVDHAAGRADRDAERMDKIKDEVAEMFRRAMTGRTA